MAKYSIPIYDTNFWHPQWHIVKWTVHENFYKTCTSQVISLVIHLCIQFSSYPKDILSDFTQIRPISRLPDQAKVWSKTNFKSYTSSTINDYLPESYSTFLLSTYQNDSSAIFIRGRHRDLFEILPKSAILCPVQGIFIQMLYWIVQDQSGQDLQIFNEVLPNPSLHRPLIFIQVSVA